MALRIDMGELEPPRRREDGSLVVDAKITRTGVFTYANSDGSIRREYRPPDEVDRADSLDTFKMVPVTNDHPPEMVTADNARKYAVGMTGQDVKMDGEYVRAPLAIFDADAIRDLENGKREVSCGYHVDVDHTPGVAPSGEHYDAIQRNIRGNHVAIVDKGRAGPNVRVRMDGTDGAIMVNLPRSEALPREDYSVDPKELAQKLQESGIELAKAQLRADQAEAKSKDLETQVETLSAERDDARDKLASAEEAAKEAEKARADQVDASVALRLQALTILPESDKGPKRFDGMTDKEIKLAVIEHTSGKLEGERSDAYIDARFDLAVEEKPAVKKDSAPAPVETRSDSQKTYAQRLKELHPHYAKGN